MRVVCVGTGGSVSMEKTNWMLLAGLFMALATCDLITGGVIGNSMVTACAVFPAFAAGWCAKAAAWS